MNTNRLVYFGTDPKLVAAAYTVGALGCYIMGRPSAQHRRETMKLSIGVVVSLTVALVGGLSLTYWVSDQSTSEALSPPVQLSPSAAKAPGLRAAVEPEAAMPAPRTGSIPLVETYQQDMAKLRQEVILLRHEVATMQQQLRAQRQTAPDIPHESEDTAAREPRTDPITARAEAKRAWHEQMEVVETTFWQEPVDPQWAGAAAAAVQGALAREDSVQLAVLRSLECRSQTCRVELADDGTGKLEKSLPLFIQHVGETLPDVTANQIPDGAGGTKLILYMSRNAGDSPQQSK